MALFVRVLGMLAVDVTGLEIFFFALGGTLTVAAFDIAATAIVAELALLMSAIMLRTMVATVVPIVQHVTSMLVGEKALFMHILFLQLAV
jgi:hypothetical protein